MLAALRDTKKVGELPPPPGKGKLFRQMRKSSLRECMGRMLLAFRGRMEDWPEQSGKAV